MASLVRRITKPGLILLSLLLLVMAVVPAHAQEVNEYRQFLGLDSRRLIWFLAQMHLFFGAFVLGVPLFAVTIEVVGWRTNDPKYDKLAYEFTSLLSVAYATTAALGGLLAFALFTLYPTFMGLMAGTFKDVMFIYALLFLAETFFLYMYYYGWDWLKSRDPFSRNARRLFKTLGAVVIVLGTIFFFGGFGFEMRGDTRSFISFLYILPLGIGLWILRDRKTTHIFIGILLNIAGTGIMQAANSWAGFMMSPAGVDQDGVLVGTVCRLSRTSWRRRWPSIECLATWLSVAWWRAPTRRSSSLLRRPPSRKPTTTGWDTSPTSSPSVASFRCLLPATTWAARSTPTVPSWATT